MDTHVRRLILQLMLIMMAATSKAQEFNEIGFKYTTSPAGYGLALIELLEKDVPVSNTKICNCTFGFFYFRITQKNSIDSIYYEGTLDMGKKDKIISNIKKTEGHWTFKRKKDPAKKFWIVYPYFDFGRVLDLEKNCTEAERRVQEQLYHLANFLGRTEYYIRRKEAMLIGPAMVGSRFITDTVER